MSDAEPVVLGPNQPQRFYRGGAKIASFRGLARPEAAPADHAPQPAPADHLPQPAPAKHVPQPGPAGHAPQPGAADHVPHPGPASHVPQPGAADHVPEDWVGSATAIFGTAEDGMTRLPDGRLLRDAIDSDPERYLGPAHVRRHGTSPALLVKLLDAGERLPVHCHPGDGFARKHLASAWGKTEAWIVVDAPPGGEVRVGFTEPVTQDRLAGWVADQDPAMLAALNRMPVAPGDAILIPAGLPHAIGEGVFVVELQEPTDLSVLLEWESFPIDGQLDGHLGLGYDLALDCVDRSPWDAGQLASLRGAPGHSPVASVFPGAADPYFAAQRIRPAGGEVVLDPGFAILVVLSGTGVLRSDSGSLDLSRGMTVLMPYAAGQSEISGHCELIRCLPPGG